MKKLNLLILSSVVVVALASIVYGVAIDSTIRKVICVDPVTFAPTSCGGSGNLAAPGPIGGTTPSTAQFTSLGVNTPAPATAGRTDFFDSTNGNTAHMCYSGGQFGSNYAGLQFGTGIACVTGGSGLTIYSPTGQMAVNSNGGPLTLQANGVGVESIASTGAQITGSLGVGTAAPATAGDIELLDATGGNTTHMCLGNYATGMGLGIGACPVSVSTNILWGTPAATILNAPSGAAISLEVGGGIIGSVASTSFSMSTGAAIQSTGGTAPTLTAGCNGAGSSVTAGSTNNRGSFVTATAASTTCTLHFSASGVWNQIPHCMFYDANGAVAPTPVSSGVCTVTDCFAFFASKTSWTIGYLCM